jgi:hypothetical protein
MLHLKNSKIKIQFSLPLKQQKHPWDMLAEKAKQLEQQHAKIHEVSSKHYLKDLVSFEEEPSNHSNQILITPKKQFQNKMYRTASSCSMNPK